MSRLLSIMTLAFALCAGVALVVSCGSGTGARHKQQAQSSDSSSTPSEREKIVDTGPGEEIEADHEWAGEYRIGGGFLAKAAEILSLEPNGHFEYKNWDCTGSFKFTGKARWVSGGIEFVTDQPRLNGKFQFVRWGKRRYLVSERGMNMFVQGVNSGWLKHQGLGAYWLHSDGRDQPLDGVPELPEPYRSMIHPNPLEPRMIALRVQQMAFRRVRVLVTFDKGSEDGVTALTSFRDPETDLRVQVEQVGATSCEASLRSIPADSRDEVVARLQSRIGEKWTERVWE